MRRVLVMGCSGSGKSTFTRKLAELTGLPTVSLDAIYWQPGWQPSDAVSFRRRATNATLESSWIMDGNYLSGGAGDLRLERLDTVFWFDLPRWVCLGGVVFRTLETFGQVRPEMAAGCPERFDLEFMRYVWTYRQQQRPKLMQFFERLRSDQRLVRFTRRRQAESYLAAMTPDVATIGVD